MLVVKNPPAKAEDIRDIGSVPGLGRSPGRRHGNLLQYSSPENPWIEETGGLQSIGLQRVRHNRSDLAWHSTKMRNRKTNGAEGLQVGNEGESK